VRLVVDSDDWPTPRIRNAEALNGKEPSVDELLFVTLAGVSKGAQVMSPWERNCEAAHDAPLCGDSHEVRT
jgi:hypothetical protein